MKRIFLYLFLPALILALAFLAARWLPPPAAGPAAGRGFTGPDPAEAILAAALYTHGEALHVGLLDEAGQEFRATSLSLTSLDKDHQLEVAYSDALNQGLRLYQLEPGIYGLAYQGKPILAGKANLAEGYTLPRSSGRKHWFFSAGEGGQLRLTVTTAQELPAGVYDVYVDIGHGGKDSGAWSGPVTNVIEAEDNLKAGLYLAQLLEAQGLKVCLSRTDMDIPGGEAAEKNPYLPGARVDSLYRSQAKYVISNHLNGGGGHGFQLYSSVATDKSFAQAVSHRLMETGWQDDNNGFDPLGDGLYKRRSEAYSAELRDYYFIIRETGGYLLSPWQYRLRNRAEDARIHQGAEALLVEYAFLDNASDVAYWQANWQALVSAVALGAADYWGLDGE